jgi:hypothetical protein
MLQDNGCADEPGILDEADHGRWSEALNLDLTVDSDVCIRGDAAGDGDLIASGRQTSFHEIKCATTKPFQIDRANRDTQAPPWE